VISRTVLLLLLPVIAAVSLFQRRRLSAVIGMGLFSLVLAATYLLHSSPDVAVTEAAIGAALVTIIYVLAIRRTGRLLVVGDEVPGLLALEGGEFVGLEVDILAGFARRLGLDLSIQIAPLCDVETILLRGDADLGAGGLSAVPAIRLHRSRDHLPTALVRLRPEADDRLPPEESPATDRCEYPGTSPISSRRSSAVNRLKRRSTWRAFSRFRGPTSRHGESTDSPCPGASRSSPPPGGRTCVISSARTSPSSSAAGAWTT